MSGAARPASGLFAEPREVSALGDLYANIWQVAYVTRDLDDGMELLHERFGVESTEVPDRRGDLPGRRRAGRLGGAHLDGRPRRADRRADRAGGAARSTSTGASCRPTAGRARLPPPRHVHRRVGDEAWDSLERLLAAPGLRVDYTVLIPDRVRAGYVDTTAELGHYLEICQLQAADIEFFSGLVEAGA